MENDQNTVEPADFSNHRLIYVPHPALETGVKPYQTEDEQYSRELFDYMYKTMEHHKGVGLAANQINLDAAVFVMRLTGRPAFIINPTVEEMSPKKVLMTEGCLSDPAMYLKIKRSERIVASWQTIEGERVRHQLSGMDARVFLHEFDHLQGIMFTDRVSKLKLEMGRKKQGKRLQKFLA